MSKKGDERRKALQFKRHFQAVKEIRSDFLILPAKRNRPLFSFELPVTGFIKQTGSIPKINP